MDRAALVHLFPQLCVTQWQAVGQDSNTDRIRTRPLCYNGFMFLWKYKMGVFSTIILHAPSYFIAGAGCVHKQYQEEECVILQAGKANLF